MAFTRQIIAHGREDSADNDNNTSSCESSPVLVLYKITNCNSDSSSPQYNAFQLPRQELPTSGQINKAVTLSHVKQHMAPILQTLNEEEGSNGYHFRFLVNNSSWYDATKSSDVMPFQSYTPGELQGLLDPTTRSSQSDSEEREGPKMHVLVLKLLDVTKLRLEECQRQMLRQKLRKVVAKTKVNTTQSESVSGPSLLDNKSIAPEEEEKKEEEISKIRVQLRIEDHPLAFACKPSMRDSVLSSSLDTTTLMEEAVEKKEVEECEEGEKEIDIDHDFLAFACKPALRERVLPTSHCQSSVAAVDEAVEAVLDPVSSSSSEEAVDAPSSLVVSTTILAGSTSSKLRLKATPPKPTSPSPMKKQHDSSSKNPSSVVAKTMIVSAGQGEVECVLTRPPCKTNHQPVRIAKKAESKPPSSAISSPCYKHHHSKISAHHHHKSHTINVRTTSPTASPTPNQWHDQNNVRSNSPSSVADFVDSAPVSTVAVSKSRHHPRSQLRVPDLNMDKSSFPVKHHSPSWAKQTAELPVAGVATKMTTPQNQNPSAARLLSSAPPAFSLHSGWEETLGLATAALPEVRQQSPPVHRKLSWDELITGSTTPTATVPPASTQTHQPQQQSFAPDVPLTHCLV